MKKYSRNPEAYSCALGTESIILDAQKGVYLGLNEVATLVWEALCNPKTFDELVVSVTTIYDVEHAVAVADLTATLDDLLSRTLIQYSGE
jgi:hypothetical protein